MHVPLERARWGLSLCPQAGEAGGAFVPTYRPRNRGVRGAAADPILSVLGRNQRVGRGRVCGGTAQRTGSIVWERLPTGARAAMSRCRSGRTWGLSGGR